MLSQHSALGPHRRAASPGSNAGISQTGSQTSTDGATAGRSTHKTRAESGWLLADIPTWRCFSWCSLPSFSLALQPIPLKRKQMSSPLLCCFCIPEVVRVLPQPLSDSRGGEQWRWPCLKAEVHPGQQQVKVLFAEGQCILMAQPSRWESPSYEDSVTSVFPVSGPHHALENQTHSFISI